MRPRKGLAAHRFGARLGLRRNRVLRDKLMLCCAESKLRESLTIASEDGSLQVASHDTRGRLVNSSRLYFASKMLRRSFSTGTRGGLTAKVTTSAPSLIHIRRASRGAKDVIYNIIEK